MRKIGPRSRTVFQIAKLLAEKGPMTSKEIGMAIGKPSNYVASYLKYWEGIIFERDLFGRWRLTKQAEEELKKQGAREAQATSDTTSQQSQP